MENPTEASRHNFDTLLESDDGFVLGSIGPPNLTHWLVAGEYQSGATGNSKRCYSNAQCQRQRHKDISDKACFMKLYCTM